MKLTALILIALTGTALAESCVVFETKFAVLPSGWFEYDWNFSTSMGAWIDEFIHGADPPFSFDATMGSEALPPVWYFVPDGTDSLVIHIEHDLSARSSWPGEAYIQLKYLSGESEYLFYQEIDNTWTYANEPVDIIIPWTGDDNYIGIRIHASIATVYMDNATITWYITDLSINAIGESLGFNSASWAWIKHAL